MPSAAITTIINGFAVMDLELNTTTDSFQDDVIYELSRGVYPDVLAQVASAFIATVVEQARYVLPTASGARTPLAIFHDALELLHLRKDEAWAYEQEWRDAPASRVVGYVYDPEDRPNFSIVPPPKLSGATIGGNTPTSVTSWPDGNLTVIYANTDLTFPGTTYADLRLPVALEVLAREFGRDSDHEDETFSGVCHNLADFFWLMFKPVGRPT